MALQVCTECGTSYAPALVCPQCGADHWVDEVTAADRGMHDHLNEGDHESISPADPLGLREDSEEDEASESDEADLDEEGEGDEPVSVADQRAAGVPDDQIVTIADQRAGARAPQMPSNGEAESKPAVLARRRAVRLPEAIENER